VWFNNKKDDGVRFPNIYKPFPKVALALILTVVSFPSREPMFLWNANRLGNCFQIENCIDEWVDGTHNNISFTQDAYEGVFNEHIDELNRFDEFTKALKILPNLLWELHDEGR